jgi:hypothetical protein
MGKDSGQSEVTAMHLSRFHVRSLMFLVWLSALLIVGTLDVVNELRNRTRLVVINQHVGADGSLSFSLLHHRHSSYYLGPIPIGPCPVAVFSGLGFMASIAVWAIWRKTYKPCRSA